ncbi:unnamed protein product [Mesocestoides corti]|uniref:Dynein heavy chain region D6 P-loop domain-containing protein n=1 Tax=Mesocestoides corti TaxID=53468 RepID=A0A0R3U9C6_MESCO|nr:unnamed protein product [Mesocestoides corti]
MSSHFTPSSLSSCTTQNCTFVVLGDKEVDYDCNFRLYLNTKLSNPRYGPRVFGDAIVINCTITEAALEDQLLGIIVRHEQSSLEEKRQMLVHTISENKQILKDLEDTMLMNLTLSTGNLLDNEELIKTTESTKVKATETTEKLALAAKTSAEVEQLSDAYRPVATRGASLFFILNDMCLVNPMYQFALGAYLELFECALRRSMPDTNLNKRLANITATLTEAVYTFQICLKLQVDAGNVSQSEVDFFIKGDVSVDGEVSQCPVPWLTNVNWRDIVRLEGLLAAPFNGLSKSILDDQQAWYKWFSDSSPERGRPPFPEAMSSFQGLCLIRCIRVDRVCRAVEGFISETLGERFLTLNEPNLDSIYEQSQASTAILFILSPGSDPTEGLKKLAQNVGLDPSSRLKFLSLGQGQEASALKLLKAASSQGSWVVLQNCHLLVKWMPTLEKEIAAAENLHPDFRLWLTTEPTPDFPVGLLQHSFKVVTEPLRGLKRNVRATFQDISKSTFAECAHAAFPVLAFTLSFFHAVVQERRQYGKLGWNIPYDFSQSDFHASLRVILDQLESSQSSRDIPWGSLRFLIEEIMYGGRVMDAFDRRVLHTYMREYFGDFLFDNSQLFHFFVNEHVDYGIPRDTTREGILGYIDTFPINNSPEVLGLHANAEIDCFVTQAHALWGHLLSLRREGKATVSGEATVESMADVEQVADTLLQALPGAFDTTVVREAFKEKMTPTAVVLLQELEHVNRLTNQMHSSLTELRRALSGEASLSGDLEDVVQCLRNGRLPNSWRLLSPPTRKSLANWFTHFRQRIDQYKLWTTSGEPVVMWLSGLHVPESYLSAVVQATCRRNGWPLDKSAIFTSVTQFTDPSTVEDRNQAGCLLQGLFIEGAAWDCHASCLKLQPPRQLIECLPVLSVHVTEQRRVKRCSTLRTPVYVTTERSTPNSSGVVFEADLAVGDERDASHWILQGVCLLLNDD